MVVSISTPADAVNAALRRIGYKLTVGSLQDGSEAAQVALDIYSQTRDALLRAHSWPFALREIALVASGQAPPSPWTAIYAWPADCLLVRGIQPSPYPVPDLAPMDILFTPYNDQRTNPATKVILTTVSPAVAIYTGRVTDPATWESSFAEALIDRLAKILLPSLGDSRLLQLAAAGAEGSLATALMGDELQPPDDAPRAMAPQGGR